MSFKHITNNTQFVDIIHNSEIINCDITSIFHSISIEFIQNLVNNGNYFIIEDLDGELCLHGYEDSNLSISTLYATLKKNK